MPTFYGNMSAAIAIMNNRTDGTPQKVSFAPSSIGLTHPAGYSVTEAFSNTFLGAVLPDTTIQIMVNPTGKYVRYPK